MGTIIPDSGRNEPRGSDVTDYTVDDAGELIDVLRARKRSEGLTRELTWAWIASRIGVPPGTIETLARRRTKRLTEGLARKLQGLLIRELRSDLERLNHELAMVLAVGGDADRFDLEEIKAQIAKNEDLLREGRGR